MWFDVFRRRVSHDEVEEGTDSARHDSGTQTVQFTIDMLVAMADETPELLANRCTLEQIRLGRRCQIANISEADLTSGEKFPWKELFKGIPLDKAQKVIGEGITKFAFRRLSEEECFEITCLDETKWLVVADDDEAYNCSTTASDYSEPEEDTKVLCFKRTGQHEILQINSFKLPQHNSKKTDK